MIMLRFKQLLCLVMLAGLSMSPLMGCEDLPGSPKTQGAVIGGAGGAAAGAVLAKEHRLLGALIGGVIGAGGGYLIGAQVEKTRGDDDDREEARIAMEKAQRDPATAEEARRARTADVNSDGFITMDEVIAMEKAGLSDSEMIRRLEATDQVFELTSAQEQQLMDAGVSRTVINRMRTINQAEKDRILSERAASSGEVISRDPD